MNKPPEIRLSKGFANIAFLSFPAIGQIKKIRHFYININSFQNTEYQQY